MPSTFDSANQVIQIFFSTLIFSYPLIHWSLLCYRFRGITDAQYNALLNRRFRDEGNSELKNFFKEHMGLLGHYMGTRTLPELNDVHYWIILYGLHCIAFSVFYFGKEFRRRISFFRWNLVFCDFLAIGAILWLGEIELPLNNHILVLIVYIGFLMGMLPSYNSMMYLTRWKIKAY